MKKVQPQSVSWILWMYRRSLGNLRLSVRPNHLGKCDVCVKSSADRSPGLAPCNRAANDGWGNQSLNPILNLRYPAYWKGKRCSENEGERQIRILCSVQTPLFSYYLLVHVCIMHDFKGSWGCSPDVSPQHHLFLTSCDPDETSETRGD